MMQENIVNEAQHEKRKHRDLQNRVSKYPFFILSLRVYLSKPCTLQHMNMLLL